MKQSLKLMILLQSILLFVRSLYHTLHTIGTTYVREYEMLHMVSKFSNVCGEPLLLFTTPYFGGNYFQQVTQLQKYSRLFSNGVNRNNTLFGVIVRQCKKFPDVQLILRKCFIVLY
ncbi:uncharacterized protein [Rhodnius prolixus]|uniref:uncharacterized protein n=1 Tax=Rhodnius prolixus TaxID=13249 RepID=UPI003D18EE42